MARGENASIIIVGFLLLGFDVVLKEEEDGGEFVGWRVCGVVGRQGEGAVASPRRRPRRPQLPVLCRPRSRRRPPPRLPRRLQDQASGVRLLLRLGQRHEIENKNEKCAATFSVVLLVLLVHLLVLFVVYLGLAILLILLETANTLKVALKTFLKG